MKATDKPSPSIDDFSHGFRDWYLLSADNPHHWQFWTRKITDPKWRGHRGDRLTFDVQTAKPNQLVVVLTENFFRSYRGRQQDFVAVVDLKGGEAWQTVSLSPSDFKRPGGTEKLGSWTQCDLLGFKAYHIPRRSNLRIGGQRWAGSQPVFRNLRWHDGGQDE